MKKSTLFALAFIGIACGSMLFLFDFYTAQFIDEIAHAKELTTEFKTSLAPDTTIRLARVRGAKKYVVHDETRPGLLVEASPSEESWARDATGLAFARSIAARGFEVYGSERPIRWIQFRLSRADRTQLPLFGFEPVEGGGLALIEGDEASSATPPRAAADPARGPGVPAPSK